MEERKSQGKQRGNQSVNGKQRLQGKHGGSGTNHLQKQKRGVDFKRIMIKGERGRPESHDKLKSQHLPGKVRRPRGESRGLKRRRIQG